MPMMRDRRLDVRVQRHVSIVNCSKLDPRSVVIAVDSPVSSLISRAMPPLEIVTPKDAT